jgi:hypothetical protein
MNLRNLLLLVWAIERGGLTRTIALLAILIFLGFFVIMFLSLVGGPGEILHHLQAPGR